MERLADTDIDVAIAGGPWRRLDAQLVLQHQARDFAAALRFVDAVGAIAEAANHHPDIDIRWNRVELRLSTHSAGALTTRDIDLASKITALIALLDAGSGGPTDAA